METAELLDISDLVSGWYRPAVDEVDDVEPDLSYHGADDVVPDGISIETAIAAIDAVLAVYPDARWTVTGTHGRIADGDRLIGLAVSLADPEAEFVAWLDAAGRLGNGSQWRACMWHERASDRPGKGTRNPSERVCHSPG